jgi:hypothetical protein
MQLEILVEEPSMEAALSHLLPRVLRGWDEEAPIMVRTFNGKPDLLRKLPSRMRGYASYADQVDLRVLVLVDRDADDCHELKERLQSVAQGARLRTKSGSGGEVFRVCNRIAVEELEAWYLGDANALVAAYPRVPAGFARRATYRHPDAVTGGTSEALHRLLRQHGYFRGGLPKVALAHRVAPRMNVETNKSPSFCSFRDGLRELVGQ